MDSWEVRGLQHTDFLRAVGHYGSLCVFLRVWGVVFSWAISPAAATVKYMQRGILSRGVSTASQGDAYPSGLL